MNVSLGVSLLRKLRSLSNNMEKFEVNEFQQDLFILSCDLQVKAVPVEQEFDSEDEEAHMTTRVE